MTTTELAEKYGPVLAARITTAAGHQTSCITSRDDLAVGVRVMHKTTGGQWKVLAVNPDGSIRAVSDMGAVRTVSAENVDAGIALAASYR